MNVYMLLFKLKIISFTMLLANILVWISEKEVMVFLLVLVFWLIYFALP